MTTVVVDDVLSAFTGRKDSHRTAWPKMQTCLLKDAGYDARLSLSNAPLEPADFDAWCVSTPMEGAGNFYGGYTLDVEKRVRRFLDFEGTIIALEQPMPNVAEICRKRKDCQEVSELDDLAWAEVDRRCREAQVVTHAELLGPEPEVVLGDSHSIARYARGRLVLRNDGLTLHGLIPRLRELLNEACVTHTPKLIICAGNIDVRHHLCRYDVDAPYRLAQELYGALRVLYAEGRFDTVEVTCAYPIEDESRKIPKTGWYKGTPFFGSRAERWDAMTRLNDAFRLEFENVYEWPQEWYDLADFAEVMEKPGSVHLSPAHYPWDLEKNEARR
jgi:hypothetical protein